MRTGYFTSSSIWKLTTRGRNKVDFGAPALTYISEKKMELKLGRSLNSEITSHPTSWGNLLERRTFDLLDMDYKLVSKDRLVHPEITNYSGAPDCIKKNVVVDIKCPFTMKSFCELVDINSAEMFKEECPEYYWQLVSNAILTSSQYAELVVYCPYIYELKSIRSMVDDFDGDSSEFNWIKYAKDNQLPWLNEGFNYKNLNIFTFEVPEIDKQLLTKSVIDAVKVLNE